MFTVKEKALLLKVLKDYPRNMREPFETNGEFQQHLKEVDSLIRKVEEISPVNMKYYDDGWNDFVNGKPFDESQRENIHYRDGYDDSKFNNAKEEI